MATKANSQTPAQATLLVGESVLVDPEAHAILGGEEFETVRPPEERLTKAVDMLSQSSLFSSTNAVWIRGLRADPPGAAGSLGANKRATENDEFLAFLEDKMPAQALLVITAAKVDKRTRLYKFFEKRKAVFDHNPPLQRDGRLADTDIARLVAMRLKQNDCTAFPGPAVSEICRRAGTGVGELFAEVDKLCLAHSEDKPLTPAAVRAVMTDRAQAWIFDMTGALGKRDRRAVVQVVSRLLEEGEAPQRLIATLATTVAGLLEACRAGSVLREPWPGSAPRGFLNGAYRRLPASAQAKFPAYDRTYYVFRDAAAFEPSELRTLHRRLLGLERSLKRSSVPPLEGLTAVLEGACIGA